MDCLDKGKDRTDSGMGGHCIASGTLYLEYEPGVLHWQRLSSYQTETLEPELECLCVLLESLRSEFPIVLVTVVGGRNERYSTQKLRSDI